ncbi:hypothetical protein [Hibiscus bacilliform virus GD1]|uniref:hypothetical protein n=1 Tax=Hibiscus bacilliform virus GD1 TaxID=1459800 RepID=UPI0003EFCEF7|nr:hypothetical protein [Hibiscus bacilliform virus GD1]AHI90952.1 hypothetical protein [Hibiscus bacilliform virus GD1]
MSRRWEEEIQKWYEQSSTSSLEYLDLASTSKVSNQQLAHNLSVIYNHSSLSSRVQIKNYKKIQESLDSIESRISKLESNLKNLTKTFIANRPLTQAEVTTLVSEISQQPKLVEAQALQLTEDLNKKLTRVEKLLHKLEQWSQS